MPSLTRFGEFEIDRTACELRRNGERIPLQIQPFRVLQTLIDNAGQVVTRETLSRTVWPERVYVDFDHGLNNAINRLRHALGDSSEVPRFIETLPRIGYRFVHALETPLPAAAPAAGKEGPATSRRSSVLIAAVVLLLVAAVAGYRWLAPGPPPVVTDPAPPTKNAEALSAYQRAQKLRAQRNKESLQLAIAELERATALDPQFALAWAALSEAYVGAGGLGASQFLSDSEALLLAEPAARRSLQLQPELGRAHIALARVLALQRAPTDATRLAIEQSFRRGLDIDPANADAHLQFGNFLAKEGRNAEALKEFRQAQQLDPLSPSVNSRLGQQLMATGARDEGLDLLRKTVELDPFQFNARIRLGWAYLELGELDSAEQQFTAADGISPGSRQPVEGLAVVAVQRNDMSKARTLLQSIMPMAEADDDPFTLALAYTLLRDREQALKWLARTARETRVLHRPSPWDLNSTLYDWLRDEHAFRQLQQEIAAANAAATARRATEE